MGYDWLDNELEKLRIKAQKEYQLDLQAVRIDMAKGKFVMQDVCREMKQRIKRGG